MKAFARRVRERLAAALGANQPASRIAAAWAVGVGIGFSPLLGLHTAVALAVAFTFRLNKVDVLLGTLVINPWTLTAYFPAAVLLGRKLTGLTVPAVVLPDPAALLDFEAWRQQEAWLRPLLACWWAGASLVAAVAAAATFVLVRRAVMRHRLRHAHRHLLAP